MHITSIYRAIFISAFLLQTLQSGDAISTATGARVRGAIFIRQLMLGGVNILKPQLDSLAFSYFTSAMNRGNHSLSTCVDSMT